MRLLQFNNKYILRSR